MGTFSTAANPGYFIEIADPADSNQRLRPPIGTALNVRSYPSGAVLSDTATQAGGYVSFVTPTGVDAVQVSTDNFVTSFVGPWYSQEWFGALDGVSDGIASIYATDARQDDTLAGILSGGVGGGGSGSGSNTHAQVWNAATGSLEPSDDFTLIVAPGSANPIAPALNYSAVWFRTS